MASSFPHRLSFLNRTARLPITAGLDAELLTGITQAREDELLFYNTSQIWDKITKGILNMKNTLHFDFQVIFCCLKHGLSVFTNMISLVWRFIGSDSWADNQDAIRGAESQAFGSITIRLDADDVQVGWNMSLLGILK